MAKSDKTSPPQRKEGGDAPVPVETLNAQLADAAPSIDRTDERDWSQVWQVPALILGVALLGIGVWMSLPQPQKHDFGAALDSAEQYFAAHNYGEAEKLLNTVGDHQTQATKTQRGHLAMLRGDLIYFQQQENQWDNPENHEKIISFYGQAKELDQPFDADHVVRWATALVALRRDAEAMAMVDKVQNQAVSYRYGMLKQLIQRRRHDADVTPEQLRTMLVRFEEAIREETVAEKRRAELIWLSDITAQLMLGQGLPQKAIDYLTPRLLRFADGGGDAGLAPLWVDLAKAYCSLGREDEALTWYGKAGKQFGDADPLNADVLVGLGQIAMSHEGDITKALGMFTQAETLYQTTPIYLDALVGRADAEARLGSHGEAIEHFGAAVKLILDRARREPQRVAWLTSIVRSHYDLSMDKDAFERALDYLTLLVPMYDKNLPAAVLLDFAVTHEKIAEARFAVAQKQSHAASPAVVANSPAATTIDAEPTAGERDKTRRLANQESAEHHRFAGEYYLRHARAVTISDDEQHGASLWAAADHFDKAQLWDRAIEVYSEFVSSRPDDPRQLEAQNRLGLGYLAEGQYEVAAKQFKRLIEGHTQTAPANASLVPLARAYVALKEPQLAQRILESAIENHPIIRPESPIYREALIELGRLHYTAGQHEKAIPRLKMAVDRYGTEPMGAALKFRLADSYRQSVAAIDDTLSQPQPQSRTLALRQERAQRLANARDLYGEAISAFLARPAEGLDELDQLFLRNACFYRGDCAFDLGDYEQAITFYDQAAKRYEQHPASLVALAQIVSCHCELKQFQAARVANDRARWQLRRIPDDAFNDPTLPMSREHWEDWLKWTSELNLFAQQANASN